MPTLETRTAAAADRRRQAGFTLVEMLITMAVVLIVILVLLQIFDSMNKLARAQVHLSEMQQNQRVAQGEILSMVRMAGLGGMASDPVIPAAGDPVMSRMTAIEIRNNVGIGGNGGQEVVAGQGVDAIEGSDVLTVRGVFNTPVYLLDYVAPETFSGGNTVIVNNLTPTGEVIQDLTPLAEAIDDDRPEALLFTDALADGYGVAELDAGSSSYVADPGTGEPVQVTLVFRNSGGTHADAYDSLSSGGTFPNFQRPLTVGILEEYRYYVTDGAPVRSLAVAQVFPGTETLHPDGVGLQLPVAEGIADLQVAAAFDSHLVNGFIDCDTDVTGDDDDVVETADGVDDDWIFNRPGNDAGEDVSGAPWTRPNTGWEENTGCASLVQPRLYMVRVGTVVRSRQPDPYYEGRTLDVLEDRTYGQGADDYFNGSVGRRHRWRILQTTVEPRSL